MTGVPQRLAVGTVDLPSLGVLSRTDLHRLATKLEDFEADRAVGTILVRGASGEFCGGLDLGEFVDPAGLDALASALERCFLAFADLSKPLIVAVDGAACGFGATMLCHADVVIASNRTRIRMPFLDLGLLPEAGSTLLLAERIGHLNAFRMICLGEEVDADEALKFGLVTKVLPPNCVDMRAAEIARDLARRPAELLATATSLMKRPRDDLALRIKAEVALCLARLRDPVVRRRLSKISSASRARDRSGTEQRSEAA